MNKGVATRPGHLTTLTLLPPHSHVISMHPSVHYGLDERDSFWDTHGHALLSVAAAGRTTDGSKLTAQWREDELWQAEVGNTENAHDILPG